MTVPKKLKRELPSERRSRKDPAQKCCLTRFAVPTGRSGNQVTRPSPGRRKAGERFKMEADFGGASAPCMCKCCEYRQYVRGYVKYRDQIQRHMLPSGELSATDFKEDGITSPPPGPHFGHRDEPEAADDRYLPARADGCEYRGSDFPGLTGAPGERFEIKLEFKGEIIDVCDNNKVVQSATWVVSFSGRLSRRRRYWD
jgi:hypothetical protein